jgi:ribosomal protein L4
MSSGALASALSTAKDQTIVVDDAHLGVNKTQEFAALLSKLELSGQKVLVLAEYSEALYRATRNLPQVSVVNPKNVGVVDVLKHDTVLVASSALQLLEGRFNA